MISAVPTGIEGDAQIIPAGGADRARRGAERVLPHAIHLEPLAEVPHFWILANELVYLASEEFDALRIFNGIELHGAIVATGSKYRLPLPSPPTRRRKGME